MVTIRHETAAQLEHRLRRVIAVADLAVLEGEYAWSELPAGGFPAAISPLALAIVGDGGAWSQLVPRDTASPSAESFRLFSFHFQDAIDNSGFVGWLASRLKHELGTGLFVTCGYNARRGGIYDYWGVPAELGEAALETIRRLRMGSDAVNG
jgi:hypothetical protein